MDNDRLKAELMKMDPWPNQPSDQDPALEMTGDDFPEGRVIGINPETKSDNDKAAYFKSGYRAGVKDAADPSLNLIPDQAVKPLSWLDERDLNEVRTMPLVVGVDYGMPVGRHLSFETSSGTGGVVEAAPSIHKAEAPVDVARDLNYVVVTSYRRVVSAEPVMSVWGPPMAESTAWEHRDRLVADDRAKHPAAEGEFRVDVLRIHAISRYSE
ncbi:MAG: hypothetical protein ABW022_00195 [Actinoplanes sp.]